MKLKDQIAIITGAGRNIGEETAKLFAAEGASIAVVDMDRGRADKVTGAIIAAGGKRRPKGPRGPDRDSSRYTASPATTGGRPSRLLAITTSMPRPRNRYTASAVPNGAPVAMAELNVS
jgi:NAD(P)-dependent dehydrogenase (short-subunit alcohol dehydrogenase family)